MTEARAISDGRVDLKALIEAAKKATPGEWSVEVDEFDERIYISTAARRSADILPIAAVDIGFNEPMESEQQNNGAFIALANPSTVAAMAEELAAFREAVKPFAEFISGDTNHRLPDDMPLTVGSQMARRQVTVRQFRALVKAAGASDSALSTQESPK